MKNMITCIALAHAAICAGQIPVLTSTLALTCDETWGTVEIADAATNAAGDAFITGSFTGTAHFGPWTLASGDNSDVFIAELDHTGQWIWAVRVGSADDADQGLAIACDGAGGIYAASELSSINLTLNTTPLTLTTQRGLCVLKLDETGALQWVSESDLQAIGDCRIAASASGVSYVAGDRNAGGGPMANFGTISLPTGWDTDTFIAALDNTGNWMWAKAFISMGGAQEIGMSGLRLDTGGGPILCGFVQGTIADIDGVQIVANPHNDPAFALLPYVARWNTQGDLQWLATMNSAHSGGFEIEAMAMDPAGNIKVIGNALDTVDLGGHMVIDPGFGDQGPCVAVLDPNGVWTDAALISGQVGPIMDVTCSPVDGSLFSAGRIDQATSLGGTTVNYAGLGDAFCGMISSTSAWAGGASGGGAGYDIAVRIHADETHLQVYGSFVGTAVFGTDTLICPGQTCSFIASAVVVDMDAQDRVATSSDELLLYPDPATDRIHVGAPAPKFPMRYTVHDAIGRTQCVGVLGSNGSVIDIASLPSGLYFLHVGDRSRRFIKE